MTIDQSATFLVGSMLTVLGFIIVFAGIIVVNNLLARYWKPVKLWTFESYPPSIRFQEPEINTNTQKDHDGKSI
jgi:hypothetical protein